jgi:hypothetical protein
MPLARLGLRGRLVGGLRRWIRWPIWLWRWRGSRRNGVRLSVGSGGRGEPSIVAPLAWLVVRCGRGSRILNWLL